MKVQIELLYSVNEGNLPGIEYKMNNVLFDTKGS